MEENRPIYQRVHDILEPHIHSPQKVAPATASVITVTSDGAAGTLGAFSADIIAAGAETEDYDIHWADLYLNANGIYRIVFYYGATDIECGRIGPRRANAANNSFAVPILSGTPEHAPIPAGSRLRAKCMDSVGGGSVDLVVYYHNY